jgi:hypothetical protein
MTSNEVTSPCSICETRATRLVPAAPGWVPAAPG